MNVIKFSQLICHVNVESNTNISETSCMAIIRDPLALKVPFQGPKEMEF
jgi:hypothetical protein